MLRPIAFVTALLLAARPAIAQTQSDSPAESWTVTAGMSSFAMRDIARSKPPVDASQIAWHGSGGALSFRYERAGAARLHRYDAAFCSTGRFSYDSGVRSTPGDSSDFARWIAGRYEYRRRILTRTLPDRIDVGIGVQALGDLRTMSRHVAPSIENGERDGRIGFAGVAAARVRVAPRLSIEGAWINGMRLVHGSTHHEAEAATSSTQWGGGWTTDTNVRADVRISSRASIVVDYVRTAEGDLAHFHSYAVRTGSLTFGVRYVR